MHVCVCVRARTHTHTSLCGFSLLLITITNYSHANNLLTETAKYRMCQKYPTAFEI